jgi:hypothetical protein
VFLIHILKLRHNILDNEVVSLHLRRKSKCEEKKLAVNGIGEFCEGISMNGVFVGELKNCPFSDILLRERDIYHNSVP